MPPIVSLQHTMFAGESPRLEGRSNNRLLASLSDADFALLMPHLEPVCFAAGDFVTRAGDPIESICFLEQGIAGVLETLDGDRSYAIGLVGVEGFIGWPRLLGTDRSPYDVTVRAETGLDCSIGIGHGVRVSEKVPCEPLPTSFHMTSIACFGV